MTLPAISVITPVYNGERYLERAIESVRRQSFPDWEMIAVDDASTDRSHDLLQRIAVREPRVQVFRREANGGPSAARNVALTHANGWMITYLDCDDEYFPDYLEKVHAWATEADLLLFCYDLCGDVRPGEPRARPTTWEPSKHPQGLASGHVGAPLGIAHRKKLVQHTGPFAEAIYYGEDCDLWLRFIKAGAKIAYVPAKSGTYYIRPDSQARTKRRPAEQARWESGATVANGSRAT